MKTVSLHVHRFVSTAAVINGPQSVSHLEPIDVLQLLSLTFVSISENVNCQVKKCQRFDLTISTGSFFLKQFSLDAN